MSVKELLLSRTVEVSNQMKNCLGEEFKLLFEVDLLVIREEKTQQKKVFYPYR